MRISRLSLGQQVDRDLVGAILARDVRLGKERLAKGRRLTATDLERVSKAPPGDAVTVLLLDPDDLHEDDAAIRIARAVAGPGLTTRGPIQSRIDLVADVGGVVHVRVPLLERLDRIDPLEVFTVHDGRVVEPGDLVASVKVAPHVVPRRTVEAAEKVAAAAVGPVVRIASFVPMRVAVVSTVSVEGSARDRFEASVRTKIEGLGSTVASIEYVDDDRQAIAAVLGRLVRGRDSVPLILTAGAASTDPTDPIFAAIDLLGGHIVRRGAPAHPGSMLWLARIRRTAVLGLPTCGSYSMATAVDLLLPRLLSGEPASVATVARLGHGGVLTSDQRGRFPRYARQLDAPDG